MRKEGDRGWKMRGLEIEDGRWKMEDRKPTLQTFYLLAQILLTQIDQILPQFHLGTRQLPW